jgi:hypothetical protein
MRDTIFISHATLGEDENGLDNEFSLWLYLRLVGMGYKVWCDIKKLKGGEDFWTEIEYEIRDNTVKYLYVLSGNSNHREGTLKELAVALKTKKELKDPHFIIPLHIDKLLSSDDTNIELVRLNSIKFTDRWSKGLGSLLERLSDIREKVCYIGLVYKLDERSGDTRNACCAAQMFLDSGDGIVFKGAVGPWYNRKKGEFHLKPEQARELIGLAVETYRKKEGTIPRELFIHAKTRFNEEEWRGFSDAVPSDTHLVGITIKKNVPLKLYRPESKFPMLRGLAHVQNDRSGFLWTKGFVPRLQTSLAMEVPNPLFIEISKGTADIETVLADILALTKLNYNACIYGDGDPVTLRFANAVGEILTAAPLDKTPPLSFKYYI